MRCKFTLFCLTSSFLLGASAKGEDAWPQFRGPDGQGRSAAKSVPFQWSATENIIWQSPVEGRGWSSPVVMNGQVWLTTALETQASAEQTKEALAALGMPVPSPRVASHLTLKAICFDLATGRLQHDVTLFAIDRPAIICAVNSFASPTPVIEPGRVYCEFGDLGTACVDTATGEVVWTRRLPIEYQVGSGSSPILNGEHLILVRDGCDQQYIIALDKTTGQDVWRTARPPLTTSVLPYRKAFSTPLIAAFDDGPQMIIPAAQWIVSYDPDTGKERWRVDTGPTFSNTSRPVVGHGMVFAGTAYGGTRLLAIQPDGHGDVTRTHVRWEQQRQVPKRSSPVLVDDALYYVSDSGIANCVDVHDGHVVWSERLGEPHSASPILADGRIYFFGEEGTTTVIRPGRQFVRLAENKLSAGMMATPAVLNRTLVVRTKTHLIRLGTK